MHVLYRRVKLGNIIDRGNMSAAHMCMLLVAALAVVLQILGGCWALRRTPLSYRIHFPWASSFLFPVGVVLLALLLFVLWLVVIPLLVYCLPVAWLRATATLRLAFLPVSGDRRHRGCCGLSPGWRADHGQSHREFRNDLLRELSNLEHSMGSARELVLCTDDARTLHAVWVRARPPARVTPSTSTT